MTCRARAAAGAAGCVPAGVTIASDSRIASRAAGRVTGASVVALLVACKGAAASSPVDAIEHPDAASHRLQGEHHVLRPESNRNRDVEHFAEGSRVALPGKPLSECATRHVLDRNEVAAVGHIERVDDADVGMSQVGRRTRLVRGAGDPLRVRRDAGRDGRSRRIDVDAPTEGE